MVVPPTSGANVLCGRRRRRGLGPESDSGEGDADYGGGLELALCELMMYSYRVQRGYGAVGSALPWHGRGQGFESP